MYRNFVAAALMTFVLLVHSHAWAGSLKTVPVRLFVDAKSKTTVLQVVNQGDEKVTLQLDAKTWRQDETGKDIYEDTGDIIFFPKIADIEKGEERIIRIGYTGKQEIKEKTYRLFLQELPVSKPGETALKLALTISIPIFVAPEKEIENWTVEAAGLSEESLRVKVKNSGTRHIVVSKIRAVGLDEAGAEIFSRDAAGWYTLAGASKFFSVAIPHEDCLKAKAVRLSAEGEKKDSKQFTLNVEKDMCTRKPEDTRKKMKEKAQN